MSGVSRPLGPSRPPATTARRIRVLVMAGEPFVGRALTQSLSQNNHVTVVGEATRVDEALREAAITRPEVAIVDSGGQGTDAAAVIELLIRAHPWLPVVAVIAQPDVSAVVTAWDLGARAVVSRDTAPDELASAVVSLRTGREALCTSTIRTLIEATRRHARKPHLDQAELLSSRERQVVDLLCLGKSNSEIARELRISESTVKSHLSRVMTKWDARDRVQVIIKAARTGLVSRSFTLDH